MIKIIELEKYFDNDFNTLLKNKDIVKIADNITDSWEDYCKWEKSFVHFDKELNKMEKQEIDDYLLSIKNDYIKWVQNCSADDLFNYELSTYQRHFMLEDNNIYYLNSYL